MLQPAQVGRGRNVSCSNCRHVWFADPRDALPDPPPARRQPMMAPPPAYPPQAYAPQGYAPQGYAPQGYPQQMAYGQPMPMMAPPPPPQPAPQPAPPPPRPAAMPERMREPEVEDDADNMAALPTDINDMFEDDEEIEPFQSLITNDDEEDELEGIESPDQMEDPDNIPEVFSADEQEPEGEGKSPILKIILIFFLLLIAAVAGGLFFFKDEVTKLVPQLGQVYEMIGFTQVGEGLQIQRESKARDNEQGIEVLVARGEIANVSDKPRPVPMLRAILLDGEEKSLQHVDMAPIKSELKPGERISFKIQIKEPSPLARRMKVTFIDPKEAGKPPAH